MVSYISYAWIINDKNGYKEFDWISNSAQALGCEIKYKRISNGQGYQVIKFTARAQFPDVFANLISETNHFFDDNMWEESHINEFDGGRPLVHSSKLHAFTVCNRLTILHRFSKINLQTRKKNIFKHIVTLRFKQAISDIRWLRQHT